jgi:predicted transcriptional regulator
MAFLKQTNRFQDNCPRKLQNPPNKPCPSALLRIEFVQCGKRETEDLPGCPYYVTDALSNYCWFNYAAQKEFGSHSTKEIAQMLALTPAQVEKAEKTGTDKLILMKNGEEIQEMRECIADINHGNTDDTIYAIGSFSMEIVEELGKYFCGSSVAVAGELDEIDKENI